MDDSAVDMWSGVTIAVTVAGLGAVPGAVATWLRVEPECVKRTEGGDEPAWTAELTAGPGTGDAGGLSSALARLAAGNDTLAELRNAGCSFGLEISGTARSWSRLTLSPQDLSHIAALEAPVTFTTRTDVPPPPDPLTWLDGPPKA